LLGVTKDWPILPARRVSAAPVDFPYDFAEAPSRLVSTVMCITVGMKRLIDLSMETLDLIEIVARPLESATT
jgi:hypothetical protein